MDIQNIGSGTANLSAAQLLIDGAASVTLSTNEGLRLVSTGSAYLTQRGQASGQGVLLSVQSSGVSLGTASTLNVVAGTGVTCIPQTSSGVMSLQCDADPAYMASNSALQSSANPQICTSSSGNGSVYTASCAATLAAYEPRQTLFWYADVANASANPTLNIDSLGAKSLVRNDGTALAAGDVKAGTLDRIWYDGANLRVVEAGLGTSGGGAHPLMAGGYGYWIPFTGLDSNHVASSAGSTTLTCAPLPPLPAAPMVVTGIQYAPTAAGNHVKWGFYNNASNGALVAASTASAPIAPGCCTTATINATLSSQAPYVLCFQVDNTALSFYSTAGGGLDGGSFWYAATNYPVDSLFTFSGNAWSNGDVALPSTLPASRSLTSGSWAFTKFYQQ